LDFDEELEIESVKFLDAVSQNVARIREEKGMTKLEVSRLMGFMTPDHYSRMELYDLITNILTSNISTNFLVF